jgi:Raf kinase inhibitor-like YbhB/YbcL family protein
MKLVDRYSHARLSMSSEWNTLSPSRALLRHVLAASNEMKLSRHRQHRLTAFFAMAATVLVWSFFPTSSYSRQKAADGHFRLESAAFRAGGFIPRKYTCSGDNVSPPFSWTGTPAGTKSFALIVADPDAPSGVWIHWIVYNIQPSARELPQSVPKTGEIKGGARQGTSSFQEVGYGGPCPPPGDAHHYHFMLYALDTRLSLSAGATRDQVDDAMKGHILAKTETVGLYGR